MGFYQFYQSKTGDLKKRKKQPKKTNSSFKAILLKVLIYSILAATIFPFVLVFGIKSGILMEMPTKEQLAGIRNAEASELISGDGKTIGRFYLQNRTEVAYSDIAPGIIDALIATEDARFYEHHGVDFKSFPRVVFRTILMGDRSGGGGSTITQQLAKNLYGRQDFNRLTVMMVKIREMLIAVDLEKLYSKKEIITMYLNTVPFGESVFGIEAACRRYYQKPAKNIKTDEAAVLVGMLKATTTYNPRLYPDRATSRRNVVLALMEKNGKITDKEKNALTALPLKLNYKRDDTSEDLAAYFREYVRIQLRDLIPEIADSLGMELNLYTSGLKIYTSLDTRLQQHAETAMARHMRELQKLFDAHWASRTKPWEKDKKLRETLLLQLPDYELLLLNNEPVDSINAFINEKNPMDVFSWEGKSTKSMSRIDSINYFLRFLHTGLLSADPTTGKIKAWVGGINYRFFKYDHVVRSSKRQVGSTFKPIVYAAALEQNVSPCEYFNAGQESYTETDGKSWTPANSGEDYEGKYSLEGALAESVNTVSVKVLEKAGLENTIDLAHSLGISSDIPKVPSIALGTASISLYEMVEAYCAFTNKGRHIPLTCIEKIEDKNGHILWKSAPSKPQQVMSEKTSIMMIEMLKNVVNQGTAARLRGTYNLPNDIAGKTGTTQSNADGWFIAMTPRLVTGVWVGGAYPAIHFRSTALGQGANTALPIYALYQQQINSNKQFYPIANAKFPIPPASVLRELDCDPFKEDLNFWQALFGKNKESDNSQAPDKPEAKEEDKGLFKGLKKLFRKKE